MKIGIWKIRGQLQGVDLTKAGNIYRLSGVYRGVGAGFCARPFNYFFFPRIL
jgi:hypothetical protein